MKLHSVKAESLDDLVQTVVVIPAKITRARRWHGGMDTRDVKDEFRTIL